MIELLQYVFDSLNNYVFGNIIYTGIAFVTAILLYMIVNNIDIGTILVMISIGTVLGSFILLPTWVAIILLLLVGIIITWGVIKVVSAI